MFLSFAIAETLHPETAARAHLSTIEVVLMSATLKAQTKLDTSLRGMDGGDEACLAAESHTQNSLHK